MLSFAAVAPTTTGITTRASGGTPGTVKSSTLLTTSEPRAADGIVNKYAIIVGISDYKAISDLSFCDEDATDWYNYLNSKGYSIEVYGDNSNSYPQFDGLATEATVKARISHYVSIADEDDILLFTSSGHGGTTRGRVRSQFLCMWDCGAGEDGENGYLYDTEFATLFANSVARVFIFLDHCFAGGMNEVMHSGIYMTTTCTDRGYGYDMTAYQNGAWTYFYLEVALVEQGISTAQDAFDYAAAIYPFDKKDAPMEFDMLGTFVF